MIRRAACLLAAFFSAALSSGNEAFSKLGAIRCTHYSMPQIAPGRKFVIANYACRIGKDFLEPLYSWANYCNPNQRSKSDKFRSAKSATV